MTAESTAHRRECHVEGGEVRTGVPGTVWVLVHHKPYEGSDNIAVFDSEANAERFRATNPRCVANTLAYGPEFDIEQWQVAPREPEPRAFQVFLVCGMEATVYDAAPEAKSWAVRGAKGAVLAGGTTSDTPSAIACLRWAVDSILERSKAEASKAFEGLVGA